DVRPQQRHDGQDHHDPHRRRHGEIRLARHARRSARNHAVHRQAASHPVVTGETMSGRMLIPQDKRGVALPMVMMVLLILSTLVVGLSALSATEPTIAGNHLMATQARSLAEAGVERAVWALQNPGHPN